MEEYSSLCFHKNKIRGIFYEKLIFNLFALQIEQNSFWFWIFKNHEDQKSKQKPNSIFIEEDWIWFLLALPLLIFSFLNIQNQKDSSIFFFCKCTYSICVWSRFKCNFRGAANQENLRNMLKNTAKYCNLLQFTAIYCNLLQFTAIYCKYCNILQNSAKYCKILQNITKILQNIAGYCKILQNITKFQEILQNIFFKFRRSRFILCYLSCR
jgi:hypothetical protein